MRYPVLPWQKYKVICFDAMINVLLSITYSSFPPSPSLPPLPYLAMALTVGKGWERVGKGLGKGWERVGKGLGKGWERVGKGLGKGWERVGKGLGKGWERVGKRREDGRGGVHLQLLLHFSVALSKTENMVLG